MRRLTVSTLRRQWNNMHRTSYGGPVPYVRLSGNWLEQAGFTPGDKIAVEIDARDMSQPSLVIRKEAEIIL